MSEQKYSSEPWTTDHGGMNGGLPVGPSYVNCEPDNYNDSGLVASGLYSGDAERIVACVNFCAGFSNEQLAEFKILAKLLSLGKSQPTLTVEHAHVYDYNRHGVLAFQAPDFHHGEALLLQALAEAHTPLTIYFYAEKPE